MKLNLTIVKIILMFPVLLFFYACNEEIPSMSYSIYGDQEGSYYVENNLTHKHVKKSESFNEAIDYAIDFIKNSGGFIRIRSGKYEVTSPIHLYNSIHIEGDGKSTYLNVSDNFPEGKSVFFADSINDVRINKLSIIQNNDIKKLSGIIYNHCGTSIISDVFMLGLTNHGAWIRNNSFLSRIDGCTFGKTKNSAVFFENLRQGRAGDFLPNYVSNCIVYSSGMGIELHKATVLDIVNCKIYQTKNHAFFIRDGSGSVLISGCRTFQIQDVAVKIMNAAEINLSNNIFCWHEKEGVIFDKVIWGTVTGNEIMDNGSFNPIDSYNFDFNLDGNSRPYGIPIGSFNFNRYKKNQPPGKIPLEDVKKKGNYSGIKFQNKTRNITVSSNAIFNFRQGGGPMKNGIEEDKTCSSNIIIGNNIHYYRDNDIMSKGKNSKVVNNISYKNERDLSDYWIQGFDLRLMDHYIQEQMKSFK
jgi:hypothetical protein